MRNFYLFFLFSMLASQIIGQVVVNQILEERIIPWDEAKHLQLRSALIKADDLIDLGFYRAFEFIALYQIIEKRTGGPDRILSEIPFSAVRFVLSTIESKNLEIDVYSDTKELLEYFYIPHNNFSYFPPEEAGFYFNYEEAPCRSLDAVAYLSLFTHRVAQLGGMSGPEPLSGFFPSSPKWWHYEYASPFLNVTIDESSGKRVTWFGEVNDAMYPVVEHPGHGLVEVEYTRIEGVLHLWWEDVVFGRCYTREEIYPYFYCERDDEWLYYFRNSSDPRWFYSLKYEAWGQYQ